MLAKLYMAEPGSTKVRALLRRNAELAASRLSFAEVAAAMMRCFRMGRIDEKSRDRGLEQLQQDFAGLRVVEPRRAVIDRVIELVIRWPLRGYDAVQLSSALSVRDAGAAVDFWCSDDQLARAAAGEGLRTTVI